MTNEVALDALCADILAHGVPSATLGAYADEIRRGYAEKSKVMREALLIAQSAIGGECDVPECDMCKAYRAVTAAIMGKETEK